MHACSVDRVGVEARAHSFTRRSLKGATKRAGLRLALSMVDLTTLEGQDSPEKIRGLCRKAIRPLPGREDLPSVAAVCVYPRFVALARQELADSGVRVASVATSFPSGQLAFDLRLGEVRRALEDGANEIDMVLDRGAFLSGSEQAAMDQVSAVKELCAGVHLKVILETGELGDFDRVRRASDLAITAGADFVKTSTGKIPSAASLPVTLILCESVRDHYLRTGRRVGVKPAGGIRRAKQALHFLVMVEETLGDAWLRPELFRFGASSLVDDLLRQILRQERGAYAASYDLPEA